MTQAAALTLDLVRHGEVATPGLLCAGPEEALSQRGIAQLDELENGPQWDLIISSPSKRCCSYAEKLALKRDIPCLEYPAFREIDLGDWTGRTTESIWKTDREQLLQLWNKPETFAAPGGETMVDFIRRVEKAAVAVVKAYRDQHVLVLTHAGVIRTIVAQMLGITPRNIQKFSVGHGKLNRVRVYPDEQISLLHWGCSPADLADR